MWLWAPYSCLLIKKLIKIWLNNSKRTRCTKMYGMHWNKKARNLQTILYCDRNCVYTSWLKERIFEIYYEKVEIYAFSGASIFLCKRESWKNFRAVNPRHINCKWKMYFIIFTNNQEKRVAGNSWTFDDQCMSVKISFRTKILHLKKNSIIIKIKY